ncbi:MAG: fibronectin type III domain-containing protein, partial [Candidatus Uhrbacteria bacterium]
MQHLHHRLHHFFRHAVLAVTVGTVMAALVSVGLVGAAGLANASDVMSRQTAGSTSNHLIEFDTPTGAAEGTTITVEFAAEFDTASITENDVDVEDDGVDLTTAPDCSGPEMASVVMAGDVLTITICPGDGGAIAAGSVVTVGIGTNATASGTGTNQIVNPGTAGSYALIFDGTFGDNRHISVQIVSSDQVTISAHVTAVPGGGVQGNPCDWDHTAPNIFNIGVEQIAQTSAKVIWDTDESSTSEVDYGKTASYELGTKTQPGLVGSHVVTLTGLTMGTTYHFRVRSTDDCDNEAVSDDQTFTTTGPLMLSDVQVINVTQTSATVIWYTNKAADSLVEYGLFEIYTDSEYGSALVTDHSVGLTGLSPDTLYHYRVVSETATEYAESADDTFMTLPLAAPPSVSDFQAEPGPGPIEITLTWTNSDAADFEGVAIYRRDDDWPTGSGDGVFIYDGDDETTVDTDVLEGVRYYYCAYSYNDAGLFSSGACDDAMIPVTISLILQAQPEKRWLRQGNWHTDFDLGIRELDFNSPFYEVTVLTNDEAGEATVDIFDVPFGTYDFSGKGLSHLGKMIYDLPFVEDNTLADFTFGYTFDLLAGDTDPTRDDFVNSLDISSLIKDLNIDNEVSDLNQDSLVNSLDINILLTNLNVLG